MGHAYANRLTQGVCCALSQPAPPPGQPTGFILLGWPGGGAGRIYKITRYMLRAITIFMISFDPPKIRVTRLSRNIRAMG